MPADKEKSARLRVVIAPGVGIGPGKAAMLEAIRDTGSIAAAGRRIGMSYKRAWLIVTALNAHFDAPLIEANKGGSAGGGARLTPLGDEVLTAYGDMLDRTQAAIAPIVARLARRLAPADATPAPAKRVKRHPKRGAAKRPSAAAAGPVRARKKPG